MNVEGGREVKQVWPVADDTSHTLRKSLNHVQLSGGTMEWGRLYTLLRLLASSDRGTCPVDSVARHVYAPAHPACPEARRRRESLHVSSTKPRTHALGAPSLALIPECRVSCFCIGYLVVAAPYTSIRYSPMYWKSKEPLKPVPGGLYLSYTRISDIHMDPLRL